MVGDSCGELLVKFAMKKIKLFDYQEDMVKRVQEAFKRHDSVMVQMPTGTGKTHVLAAIVGLFVKKNVWVVAHRRELVSQIKDTLGLFFPSFDSEQIKVISIQWLSRHYREIKEIPSLIVIDEAHHALAETYAEVMNAYPKAKKLGLTATPYRMNGKGFTDLFDTLLCSWSMERFIAEGRLSLYDYYSIKPDSADQLLINSLQKRGADGDYQQKELNEVMDVRPSLERLCLTIKQYVPGMKGIVYAINIQHAEHIAEFYRENGIKAVAISSKTPSSLRKELIERFKASSLSSSLKSFSNHPVPLSKEGIFPTTPSLLRKEGSTSTPSPSSSEGGDVAGDAIALPGFSYRQQSLCPQGADDDSPTQQSCDCLCGVNRLDCNIAKKTTASDEIEVLVSVDLFSEGFDCPDVEFIQLARPTLSLAKYMQMVGRGLRVTKDKEYCVILDNVGLYKRFGLPSVDRDWKSMFEGKASLEDMLQEACLHVNSHNCKLDAVMDVNDEMMKIISHERQQRMMMDTYGYRLVENDLGLMGIKDKEGKVILDCQYKKIEVTNDSFAHCYIRKKGGRKEWLDLRNGLWFTKRPQSVKLLGIDFCTEDGKKLYPRIRSKFIDENAYLTVKTLELQVGAGLSWKRRFIPWDEPNKVYYYKEGVNDLRLYYDDDDNYVAQENIGSRLIPIPSQEVMEDLYHKHKERCDKERIERQKIERTAEHYDSWHSTKSLLKEGRMDNDGIVGIKDSDNGKEVWVDTVTKKVFMAQPTIFKRGFVSLVKDGDWCYIRNIPGLTDTPFRQWEIRADDNICVIDNRFLFVKEELLAWYKIYRKTDDFSYFMVKEYSPYRDMDQEDEIQITQLEGEGLKMTRNGTPYRPFVLSRYVVNWYWGRKGKQTDDD